MLTLIETTPNTTILINEAMVVTPRHLVAVPTSTKVVDRPERTTKQIVAPRKTALTNKIKANTFNNIDEMVEYIVAEVKSIMTLEEFLDGLVSYLMHREIIANAEYIWDKLCLTAAKDGSLLIQNELHKELIGKLSQKHAVWSGMYKVELERHRDPEPVTEPTIVTKEVTTVDDQVANGLFRLLTPLEGTFIGAELTEKRMWLWRLADETINAMWLLYVTRNGERNLSRFGRMLRKRWAIARDRAIRHH